MSGRLIVLVLASFALLVGALMLVGVLPQDAARELFRGSLGTPRAISGTLKETTPLLIAGIAVFLALKAGLFNIGVEGQFVVGALAAAVIGVQVPGTAGMLLGVLSGIAVGGLWALLPALIKAYRNGHEVITTIMLNNIALFVTRALVAGSFKDPAEQSPTTASVPAPAMLPDVYSNPPLKVSLALVVGLAVLAAFAYWLKRSVSGYELSATGANRSAAQAAGVQTRKVMIWAMIGSGALGGLAGAFQVLAFEGRFYSGFSPGYGFDALGVAILAGNSPWGLVPSSLVFGLLNQGSTSMTLVGVPKGITGVLLGLLIVVFAAFRYRGARNGG